MYDANVIKIEELVKSFNSDQQGEFIVEVVWMVLVIASPFIPRRTTTCCGSPALYQGKADPHPDYDEL